MINNLSTVSVYQDLQLNSSDSNDLFELLGKTDTDSLAWIIPCTIAAIIFLFLAGYGLYMCIVNMGDYCFQTCGCFMGSKRSHDDGEDIRLLDYQRPMYESSTQMETNIQML